MNRYVRDIAQLIGLGFALGAVVAVTFLVNLGALTLPGRMP